MKFFRITVAVALIASAMFPLYLPVTATHTETKEYRWFINKTKDQKPPPEHEYSFIEKYDGYYVDRKASNGDKVIYLTFDAGYENENCGKILDVMKKHEVPSAWFILDNLLYRNMDMINRLINEGHEVCNHTAKHPNMAKITDKELFAENLTKLETLYKEKTGLDMAKYYRPPSGTFSELNMRHAQELGYKTVFWSMAYADWDNAKQPCVDASFARLMEHTHNGMVLLLHPTSATNAAILDRLISAWKAEGYRFGTMEELCA